MGLAKGLVVSVVLCLILLVCIIGSASAQVINPQVTLNFDPGTCTYTYHVIIPQGDTNAFGQLCIYAKACSWNGHEDTWTVEAPQSQGQTLPWDSCGITPAGQFDTIEWRTLDDQLEIHSGPWEGDFIVIAPGTTPVAGRGMTKDGIPGTFDFDIDVPGVPEPSSLLALASMFCAGILVRKRK